MGGGSGNLFRDLTLALHLSFYFSIHAFRRPYTSKRPDNEVLGVSEIIRYASRFVVKIAHRTAYDRTGPELSCNTDHFVV